MSGDSQDPLRDLRDALRQPIPDIETFNYHLSSALQGIDLHPTSASSGNTSSHVKSMNRFLPTIQLSLLTASVPTFLPSLDEKQKAQLEAFFVPLRISDKATLPIRRAIALTSYLTLASMLSTTTPQKTTIPLQSQDFLLATIDRLVSTYGVDEVYWSIWSITKEGESSKTASSRELQWEEAVKALVGLPGKVANAIGRWKADGWAGDIPEALVPKSYFDRLLVKLEGLMYELSQSSAGSSQLQHFIQRLAAIGLFSSPPSLDSRSPSFWTPILPSLLRHLHPDPSSPLPPYPASYLPSLFLPVSTSTLNTLVGSLLYHLSFHIPGGDLYPDKSDERIKRASQVLSCIIGPAKPGGEAMEAVLQATLTMQNGEIMEKRSQALVRTVVGWLSISGNTAVLPFLDASMDAWTDTKYIRYALYAQQFNLTHTLILALSLLPSYDPRLITLSHRPRFLTAMQTYLSHPDRAIRRLGILVAEIVSELTIVDTAGDGKSSQQQELDDLRAGLDVDEDVDMTNRAPKGAKRLRFGSVMWDGSGEGKDQARWLRSALGVRDSASVITDDHQGWLLGWDSIASFYEPSPSPKTEERGRKRASKPATQAKTPTNSRPKIVMLDDAQAADPLQGYTQDSPSSSRSPSPTPSFLEEVAADPSLALGATGKKLQRPVYISQLLALLKEREKPEHLEMALKHGEALIRAKRAFGTELEENATSLAVMAVALNDPFNLEEFDEKRQGIMNALVACSPRNVAPYLCEIYFLGQYALSQRSVILTALAMGARELAGLSVPLPASARKIDFPSKTLPPALHRRYIGPNDAAPDQLEQAIDGVRGLLLSKGAKQGEETIPELAREKRLRVGSKKKTMVAEIGSLAERQMSTSQNSTHTQTPVVPFKNIATECFIMPLINRFWLYYNDSTTRQARMSMSGEKYHGAGTGMILSPMALEKYLMTLALLVHAARNSGSFLNIIAREALELSTTIGVQHSRTRRSALTDDGEESGEKEASVIGSSLELCLVCLDASFELDGGRTLAMDKPESVMAVGEWATGVFQQEEGGGERMAGQGGMREGRVRAAAAGVVVKVSDIGEKWGRLGVM